MSGRRRSPLTPEDRAVWRAATRDAVPLPPGQRGNPAPPEQPSGPPPAKPAARPEPRPKPETPRPPRARPAPKPSAPPPRVTLDLAPEAAAPLGHTAPGLDRGLVRRLRRGALEPEARVDLHGLSAERAHRALEHCIGQALARGQRLVLVITGKGGPRQGPGPDASFAPPPGLLRRQSPRWLRAGPHAGAIVGMFQAHRRHGGAGAFYVYLKRRR